MSDSSEKEVLDVVNTRDAKPRQYIQKFTYGDDIIEHQNRLQVEKTQRNSEPLLIRNHFATIEGGQVIKITEVIIGDKIIKIIDQISLPFKKEQKVIPEVVSKKEELVRYSHPRKNILEKKCKTVTNKDGEEQFKLRDTKNVVKNVYKLFQGWVEDQAPTELRYSLKLALADLLNVNRRFNNNLIICISRSTILRKAFIAFSQTEGENLIGISRIQDKNSHLQALRRYRNLCATEELDTHLERQASSQSQLNNSSEHHSEQKALVAE